MYEDAWFNPIVPAQTRQESSHKRRVSLLKQPNVRGSLITPRCASLLILSQEEDHADVGIPDTLKDAVEIPTAAAQGPPEATLARRAKSYSDFYHVVREQLKKDGRQAGRESGRLGPSRRSSQIEHETPKDFDDCYEEAAEELLKTSNEKYT